MERVSMPSRSTAAMTTDDLPCTPHATKMHDLEGTYWLDCRLGLVGSFENVTLSGFCFGSKTYEADMSNVLAGNSWDLVAFYDEWHITKFRRYRPLIYWVAYGSEVSFAMLSVGLRSLQLFGDYGGDILIISDRSRSEIAKYIPASMAGRWHVLNLKANDTLDYTVARYRISEWGASQNFGPVLYVDTDVLIDAPLDPMLIKIALEKRIVGQGGAGPLWRDMGVGAHLLQSEGYEFPPTHPSPQGFCSGTLGIPSIREMASDLSIIYEAIKRYSASVKDRTPGWYDQPTANYVLYKTSGECPNTISDNIRWGGKNALHGGDRPCGLVHLWGGADKLAEMKELMALLLGEYKDASSWTVYGQNGKLDHVNFRTSESEIK